MVLESSAIASNEPHPKPTKLPLTSTEVYIKLRKPPLNGLAGSSHNYFSFSLGPGSISMNAQVKRPGEELISMPATLTAVEDTVGEVDAYERLLGDAMQGDSMLFVREDAVEAAWAVVDPILGNSSPLHAYAPGSWGPAEADRLAAALGGWPTGQRPSRWCRP